MPDDGADDTPDGDAIMFPFTTGDPLWIESDTDGSDGNSVWVVTMHQMGVWTELLAAFPTEDGAQSWRESHVSQYDPVDDSRPHDYHIGMGGKAEFHVQPVDYKPNGDPVETDDA